MTFGVFDLFHTGHLNFLTLAVLCGKYLIVGVMEDEDVLKRKGHKPIIPCTDRELIVGSMKGVLKAVPYKTGDYKKLLLQYDIDTLVVNREWGSQPSHIEALKWMRDNGRNVVVLDRAEGVSTSDIKIKIKEEK